MLMLDVHDGKQLRALAVAELGMTLTIQGGPAKVRPTYNF